MYQRVSAAGLPVGQSKNWDLIAPTQTPGYTLPPLARYLGRIAMKTLSKSGVSSFLYGFFFVISQHCSQSHIIRKSLDRSARQLKPLASATLSSTSYVVGWAARKWLCQQRLHLHSCFIHWAQVFSWSPPTAPPPPHALHACCCRLPHQLEQSLAIAAAPLVNTQSMTPYSPWRTFLLLLLLPLLLCLGELMSATLDN